MANAETAPLKKEKSSKDEVVLSKEQMALNQEFDPEKVYVFELTHVNFERELPVYEIQGKRQYALKSRKHNIYQNLVMTSQVIWNNRRRIVRYYDGCTSIFADEQPDRREDIEAFINQTQKRFFIEGKLAIRGDERMLLLYMNICSWYRDSPFKTKTSNTVFFCVNADENLAAEASIIDQQEKALEYARTVGEVKMLIHAAYLGVPKTDYDSGNELTPAQVRVLYRKKALEKPKEFLESFGNNKIELKYYIDKALEDGSISNKDNPNKAKWKSGRDITDISGLKSSGAIADRLFEFSQTAEGEEFSVQLKALYNN